MYNPFSGYPITDGWESHRARGSLGGIDYGMGMGTPLPACAAGVVTYIAYNGTGGHTATIRHDDGTKTQYMHMSRFALSNGARVNEGDIVGYSGGCAGCDGAGSSTGPHLHAHSINTSGTRIPPLFAGMGGGGGSGVNWMGGGSVEAWIQIQNWLTGLGLYSGPIDGDPRTMTWTGLQTYLQAHAGYTGTIDGEPGVLSWSAMQRLMAALGFYGGDIDGVPGPITAAAINSFGAHVSKPALKPTQRQVANEPLRRRPLPKLSSKDDPVDHAANSVLDIAGWINGESVEGNPVWFLVGDFYSWSGGFTSSSTANLKDLNKVTPPPPDPEPEPEFPAGYYRPTDAPAGSLFGIDVSRYQPDFDFAMYKSKAKEDFAILKRSGSNSGTYIDSKYERHLPLARAAGLKLGHYHFNGREDVNSPAHAARFFLTGLDIKPGEVVVLDIENEGTMAHYSVAEAMEFGAEIEKALGIKPILYMSASVARQSQWRQAKEAGYELWVAMYSWLTTSPNAGKYVPNDIDSLGPWGDGNAWTIHQYTSTVFGTMPGHGNNKSLDRNIARPDTFSKLGFVKVPDAEEPDPEPTDPKLEARVLDFARGVRDAADKLLAGV